MMRWQQPDDTGKSCMQGTCKAPTCVTLSQPGGLAPGGSRASQASLLRSARLMVPGGTKVWRARSAGPMACQRLRACQPQARASGPLYSRQVGALGEAGSAGAAWPGHLLQMAVQFVGGEHCGSGGGTRLHTRLPHNPPQPDY
jgi:hypothetical protein